MARGEAWRSVLAILVTACQVSSSETADTGTHTASSTTTTTSTTTSTTTTSTTTPSGGSSESGESSTSGDPIAPPCLPAKLRGPQLTSVAGWNVYEAVGDGAYMLERPGAELLDADAVKIIFDGYSVFDLQDDVPGVLGGGYGLCLWPLVDPEDPDPTRCLSIYLATHTSTVETLTQALALTFADASAGCFGVRVDWIGLLEPRCTIDDPECDPLPKCPTCSYVPAAERTPAGWSNQAGSCTHDGDCFLNGCSSHCHAWTEPGFIGGCDADPGACANCGCVDGLCQWFVQDIDDPQMCW